ncbi:MAG: hypothetical protein AAF515_12640 [Pseudomonadota bacterium]
MQSSIQSSAQPLIDPIRAQAHLHHAWFLGLQLMIASREGPDVMGDWMFRLFRRQHEEKFLSSFRKLGLDGLPDAVACARYHVLSNNIGGVGVEFMPEHDRKAWVRFRYPRWMYHGPTICGIPVEVSRGFLRGWYAHNGVSLNNPRLGFVCVSEDMTGEFGLCGYFREFDHELSDAERLQFARDETPPPFDAASQPAPPPDEWSVERLEKANRNYALEYLRNGFATLVDVIDRERVRDHGRRAARLIGLQYFAETAAMIGAEDGGLDAASDYLMRMLGGMGDEIVAAPDRQDQRTFTQRGLRVVRGLDGDTRTLLLDCWLDLWRGALDAPRARVAAEIDRGTDELVWTLRLR